ncbi:hypothetical protein RRF57_001253 [Xylaria bambusicola]|uniref:Uncharacterized protein n=1 Tax=Xylaria bambusicola TaxID=326684 RepID=A0AAN7Z1F9_9PEZI
MVVGEGVECIVANPIAGTRSRPLSIGRDDEAPESGKDTTIARTCYQSRLLARLTTERHG